MKHAVNKLVILFCISLFLSCTNREDEYYGDKIEQVAIHRVEAMPNLPQPYQMMDWKAKAKAFDRFIFDWNNKSEIGPLIWLDDNRRNVDQTTFGLYTAIKDIRQGKNVNNGEFHESLNSLAAILGAGLVGIDKTNQEGYNYVKMVQNYFNTETGWNIMMNNTTPSVALLGGGYGRDWWYDVFPNALYYVVCDVFPGVEGADEIQHTIAEQFVKADSVLNGNYDYSWFDYARMEGKINGIPLQQDAAGGHAYVLMCAYRKYGDSRYLNHSKSAVEALLSQKESRFYEVLLPLGVYTAACLNATEGTDYDVRKLLDWVFDGCKSPTGRNGWGVIVDKWGDYDVSGLQGSITDKGGYAFLMNSIKPAWPFVPMVKYQPQFARAIGKWMLNNANACRLFYPMDIDSRHQWLPESQTITNNNVSYEGLCRQDAYGKPALKGISPVAIGDGPNWIKGNPDETMFSVYSSSPVGILGAIVEETDVEGILQLDCNATDFYTERPYPVYLYYNPYNESRSVTFNSSRKVDLFDIIKKEYVAKNLAGDGKIEIPADEARVIVVLPAGIKVEKENGKLIVNKKHIISYQ
jgi:intracellular sulfur oxidation DsrE/DsrF family protein